MQRGVHYEEKFGWQARKDFELGVASAFPPYSRSFIITSEEENDFVSVYDEGERDLDRTACSLLWERVYLWYDGSVNPCDIDHLSTLCVGNINKGASIAEIWKGKAMMQLRKEHMESHCQMGSVCKNCTGY